MQQICDLYFPKALDDYSPLQYLHIFHSDFIYDPKQQYMGYLNVNVRRIALVNFVMEFRKRKMQIYNVPVQYRDSKNLSQDEAFECALKQIDLEKNQIVKTNVGDSPVIWRFPLIFMNGEEKTGAGVSVDKLDGHIWTQDESEEYFYDFNGVI
ncbi:hypothetical protein [Acinetobacter sp. CFCC 10889]|uniref:hypothetical protein n=1 Tax=Acinetobacter sp. CFCC 10889 TaxID=1775557 RepID=UPI000DD0B917|nr:hypothetical protein [Acinetobacter sp. CFCC 10889]